MRVKPKKHLGQHFLKDESVCQRISEAIPSGIKFAVEVGPGTGALTKYLLQRDDFVTHVMDVDQESIEYLHLHFSELGDRIHYKDFLKMDPSELFGKEQFMVVGNFPYNISSQILFKVLDHKDQVPVLVGMFQKEVAERVAENPGNKQYGITSVLLQAYYDIEYLFTVDEDVFDPPPKVKSGVIRLVRNDRKKLPCDEKLFKQIVKASFNQRRKTIRNSLKRFINESQNPIDTSQEVFSKRPETLGVEEFIELTQQFEV